MPTYEYRCTLCCYEWEVEQSIKEPPLDECPRCTAFTAQRLVSGGSGFTLRGDGWSKDRYSKPTGSGG